MTDARVPLTGAQQLDAQLSILVDLLEKVGWINDVGHRARVALASVLTSSMQPLTDILQRLERLESRSSQDACPPETTAAGCGGTWDVNTGEVVRTYFFEGYASQWVKLDDVQQLLAAARAGHDRLSRHCGGSLDDRDALHVLRRELAKFEEQDTVTVHTTWRDGEAKRSVPLEDVAELLAAAVEVDHAYWCSPQSLTRVRSAMHALASARAKFEKFEEPT